MPSIFRKFGGLRFPLNAGDFDGTLTPLDPVRDTLLALFAAAINEEFNGEDAGEPWAAVVAGVDPLVDTEPVQSTWPGPPTLELMQQRKTAFPALFLYRDGRAEFEEYSLAQTKRTQPWTLDYILAPLAADDFRRASDILFGVSQILPLVVEEKGHPAYQGGASVTTGIGLSTLEVTGAQWGQAKFGNEDGPTYLSLTMTLRTTELSGFLDDVDADFSGFDLTIGTGNADGIISPLVYVDSSQELQSPAITPPFPASY